MFLFLSGTIHSTLTFTVFPPRQLRVPARDCSGHVGCADVWRCQQSQPWQVSHFPVRSVHGRQRRLADTAGTFYRIKRGKRRCEFKQGPALSYVAKTRIFVPFFGELLFSLFSKQQKKVLSVFPFFYLAWVFLPVPNGGCRYLCQTPVLKK